MSILSESSAPVRLPSNLRKILYDEPSSSVAYLGTAAPGSTPADAVWRIQRLSYGPGNNLIVEWADGDAEYDNVWDNRSALNYS